MRAKIRASEKVGVISSYCTSFNNLRNHVEIFICFLQFRSTDPNVPISGDILTSLIQHLHILTYDHIRLHPLATPTFLALS